MTDPALLNLLPPLRRARGDRLYGPDGRHWVDLWKQDGAWLLGRRPDGAAKEWKNQLDKGLAGWAPSRWPERLVPLVKQLISDTFEVRVFRNADRAPVVPLWRPWSGIVPPSDVLRPVLPTGPSHAVCVAYTTRWKGPIPDHDITSPAEAAALVQAALQVLRLTDDTVAMAARRAAEEAFDRHLGSGLFRRNGIWFQPVTSDYAGLFRAFLAAGFVLNPDPDAPGVIPTLSEGEWAAWKTAAETWMKEKH